MIKLTARVAHKNVKFWPNSYMIYSQLFFGKYRRNTCVGARTPRWYVMMIFFLSVNFINNNEIPKAYIYIGSWKLIRNPRCDFFAPVNSTGCGVPPPQSTGRQQLLCQGFSKQCEDRPNNSATDWWDLHMQIPSTSATGKGLSMHK